MIRRRVGDEFWLITQEDHAHLSGELAKHVGNRNFARPAQFDDFVLATARHDAGWALHDDQPTLNDAALPRDVFEMEPAASHEVWLGSAKQDGLPPYARLLVALHQFHLSAMSVPAPGSEKPKPFEIDQLRRQFEINKFQHAMIEQIETLRGELGLATTRPLRLGLADGWSDAAEDALRYDFRMLQALDGLSLALCCTRPPRSRIGPLHERPGSDETVLTVDRIGAGRLIVSPWPFESDSVRVAIPYRAVPARPFGSPGELAAMLAAAPREMLECDVVAD